MPTTPPTPGTNTAQYIELGVNILLVPLLTYGRRWVRQQVVDPIQIHKAELEEHMSNNKEEFRKQAKINKRNVRINKKIVEQLNQLNVNNPYSSQYPPPPTPSFQYPPQY